MLMYYCYLHWVSDEVLTPNKLSLYNELRQQCPVHCFWSSKATDLSQLESRYQIIC